MGKDTSVFAADGRTVIGRLTPDGVFIHPTRPNHIIRVHNARGMDKASYLFLKAQRCRWWEMHYQDGQVLRISFGKVGIVGFEEDLGRGVQMCVRLDQCDEKTPAVQRALL